MYSVFCCMYFEFSLLVVDIRDLRLNWRQNGILLNIRYSVITAVLLAVIWSLLILILAIFLLHFEDQIISSFM